MKAIDLLNYLSNEGYEIKNFNTNNPYVEINTNKIRFDLQTNKYSIDGLIPSHERIVDLTKPENHSVVMMLIKLFEKGYSKSVITLEKQWQLGHSDSGSLDIMIKNPSNDDIYMIEVKSSSEINSYVNLKNEKKLKQKQQR